VYLGIKARAESVLQENRDRLTRVSDLRRGLDGRCRELSAAKAELSIERFCDWPTDYLIDKVTRRNALAYVVERIQSEIERVEAEYNATIAANLGAHWKALSDLAAVQVKEGIPPADLAVKFDSTPQEMVSAVRWERHIKQEHERAEAEERRRLEREQREQEWRAGRESYIPPASIGCAICDHEKSHEIHTRIYDGMPPAAVESLRAEYNLPPGAITEHWNGHPTLRPKLVIPWEEPKLNMAAPGLMAGV
jgi:hypothetical protein